MGAMYRLKAYFGMVPAEELTEYVDDADDRYPAPRGPRDLDDPWPQRRRVERDDRVREDPRRADAQRDDPRWEDKRWAERSWQERDESWDEGRWDDGYAAEPAAAEHRGDPRADDPRRADEWPARRVARPPTDARRRPSGLPSSPVRGSLAIEPEPRAPGEVAEPARPVGPAPVVAPAAASTAPDQRDRVATLARITTLQPRSYKEARTIGERYRDGVPVIMNLTELDVADAKRLVDFAAGLAFALRGSIDKVTNRVFLLTPADVEVSADDARKLAERGLFRQD